MSFWHTAAIVFLGVLEGGFAAKRFAAFNLVVNNYSGAIFLFDFGEVWVYGASVLHKILHVNADVLA